MIHVAIIGLGAIGQRLIPAFQQHPDYTIYAVCDVNQQLAEQTATTYNIGTFTNNYQQLLDDTKVDLVYVAVPPKYHHQIVLDTIARGKHILCEKPLANSLEEAQEIHDASRKSSIVHAMNFPLHYSPGSSKFRQLLKENYIGSLRRVELFLRFPEWPRPWQQNDWVGKKEQGGFVLEVGVHYIHQMQTMFGPLSVKHMDLRFPEDPTASENSIIAHLELENGTPVVINGLSQIAGEEEIRFTVYGSEGTLSLVNWAQLEGAKIGDKMNTLPVPNDNDRLLEELAKSIRGEKGNIVTFKEGLEAQEILEQLRKGEE
ncbi:Gfo/Idh/MocA family protein [Mangrovibacillus cuniculi]|uniref:Gfo/Idh/MocA family oxidoreductase n=1 Tax=Mangrovibacillus cuniculi TaxID=2593652 RepID=A0A7S8CD93_9BACI|nr:Gfo/Idh/MocA family oxidoreductase [Mangrovibacillus cuniculi]QPC47845.1 Gfo/Idh/MocA family oxidoreductase [Mangrovibacillus cuniculi]